MAAPTMTQNASGNIRASATLAANTTSSAYDIDLSSKFEGQIQVSGTFGTVAATAGLQVQVFRKIDTTPEVDTIAILTFNITATASTTQRQSFALSTGKYQVKLVNLDATNAVTAVIITMDTVDAVS